MEAVGKEREKGEVAEQGREEEGTGAGRRAWPGTEDGQQGGDTLHTKPLEGETRDPKVTEKGERKQQTL